MKKVEIYSDGGARPNPGSGGYGVVLKCNGKEKELSGFEENTTNNRMELTGVIKGLENLKESCEVEVYTDSSYVVNGIEKGWAEKWKTNNWMRTKTEKALNYDLWEKLLNLISKHKVHFNWIKGHIGHTENERCDTLATNEILKRYPEKSSILDKKIKKSKKTSSKKELITKINSSKKNIKMTKEGQNCKKCGTPIIKTTPKKNNKNNKNYYYKFYLTCPNCKTNYFVDEAKIILNN